jgi:acyl-CoA thioesterase FadM
VHVFVDNYSRRPVALSNTLREGLQSIRVSEPAKL